MEKEDLEKYFAQIDCHNLTVHKHTMAGFWNKPVSGEEKENVLVEILKSLCEKYPKLKEKLLLGVKPNSS